MADLFHQPLAGRATVIWRDSSIADCQSLADVAEVGLPAVVSLTEYEDLADRDELLDLLTIAIRMPVVEFIVATRRWFDTGHSVIKPVRKLAALRTVSLGMVCDHVTGLINVKGAALCWDYRSGTPRMVPSVEGPGGQRVEFKQHCIIGINDWTDRAKAVRAIPTGAAWHEFVG